MILVAGSANIDFVTHVPHIPAPGETILGPTYFTAPGGKGANQALAAGRAGAKVDFLGAMGQDSFAQTLQNSLSSSGVGLNIISSAQPTGAAFISVSAAGENAITVASGANMTLAPQHLPDLSGYQWLVLQLEIALPTVKHYAQQARAQGVRVILNAAPAQPLDTALLENIEILVVNEGELRQQVGAQGSLTEQLRRLQARGPQTIIVTLGERGSLTVQGNTALETPAFAVTPLDTTGAGDTFVGVLAALLDEGATLESALQHASAGAALACTRQGAQPSMPSRQDIMAFLAQRATIGHSA